MAGLLDLSPDQWQALTLLGSGVAAGNAPGGFQAASSLLADAPMKAKRMSLLDGQIADMQAQAQERAMKLQREQEMMELARRKQAALPGLFGGGMQPAQPGQIGSGSFGAMPAPAGGDMPQRQPGGGQFDVQAAIRAGFSPKEIMEYAALRNANQDEVARTIEGMDPRGRPVTTQFDKFGRPVGAPVEQWKAPVFQGLGNRTAAIDPVTLKERGSFAQGVDPGTIYSGNITMRGQNMVDARAREATNAGKAPTGYRFKPDGALEAIPGGPADIKSGELGAKREQSAATAKASAQNVLGTISEARELVGPTTAGFGSLTASVPGTPGFNLSQKLQTIKANIGFDRLQQMRAESPTGGALGQVAVQELVALQSTVASLDQKQSPAQIKQSLDKIEKHYKRWAEVVQQANGGSGGAGGGWSIQKVQ